MRVDVKRVLLWGQYMGHVIKRGHYTSAEGVPVGSRFLVEWWHADDGLQKTWVDSTEVRPVS